MSTFASKTNRLSLEWLTGEGFSAIPALPGDGQLGRELKCGFQRRPIVSTGCSLRWCAVLVLLLFPLSTVRSARAQSALTAEQWRGDLHYLVEQVIKTNPRAFHHANQQEFEAAASAIAANIPKLSDHEVELEFVRLVAMLGEGHSRISLPGLPDPMSDIPDITPVKDPRLAFHRLPVRLYSLSDGLFLIAATPEFKSLVGSRVLRIGDRPVQEVLEAVRPLINRDNDMGIQLIAPDLIVVPEVLQALRIIPSPSRVAFTLQTAAGKDLNIDLAPLPTASPAEFADTWEELRLPRPVYLRHPEKNFWMEYLAGPRTLFVGIHVIEDMAGETLAKFARELDSWNSSGSVDRFVVDFRDCHGGDNQKFRALLLAIIRKTQFNQLGKTFVIINRGTFSAAVNAATDLERLSNGIFVGEPTAGAPSSWGDPHKIMLPNSGLVARISTVYWSDWTGDESRPWLAPDLAVAVSAADYFAGHDPALDTVLSFPWPAAFEDVLGNLVRAGAEFPTILRLYYQHKTDPEWADESTRQAMQRVAVLLIARKQYRSALVVFQINLRDYPDSFAAATQSVQQALAANPHDVGLADLAEKLKDLQAPVVH